MDICVILLLLVPGVWCQTLTVQPSDTVALSGSSATFYCNSSADAGIRSFSWLRNATASNPVTIVSNCQVVAAFTSQYATVGDPVQGQCSLRVISATPALAAVYRCIDAISVSPDAALVILGSVQTGSQSPANLFAGDRLTVSCWVSFTGSIAPWFTWTSTVTKIATTNSSNVINSTGSIVAPSAPAAVIDPATCAITFPAGTVYTPYNWTSTAVTVQYCPVVSISVSQVTPTAPVDITSNDVLVCSANAYPPNITYHWINETDTNKSTLAVGTNLKPSAPGVYNVTCVAVNNVTSSTGVVTPCNGNHTITINVSMELPTTYVATTTQSTQQGSPTTAVINTSPPPGSESTTVNPVGGSNKSSTWSCSTDMACVIPAVVVTVVVVVAGITILLCCLLECCPGYKHRPCQKGKNKLIWLLRPWSML
jgi:hypothetical protein